MDRPTFFGIITTALLSWNQPAEQPKLVDEPKPIVKLVSMPTVEQLPAIIELQSDGNCPNGQCELPRQPVRNTVRAAASVPAAIVRNIQPVRSVVRAVASSPCNCDPCNCENCPAMQSMQVHSLVAYHDSDAVYRLQPLRNIARAKPVRSVLRRAFCR